MFTFTVEEFNEEINRAISAYNNQLYSKGVFTKEGYEELSQYNIVIAKKGFFHKIYDKLFKNSKNTHMYFVVKILNKPEESSQK